jgi:DNA-binding beta-propeller fold protein YncE
MVVPVASSAYAAVPSAPMNQTGAPPGAVVGMNLTSGTISATISVPGAQTVVASPDGTQLLVFSNDSDLVTVIYPLLVNTGNNPVTVTVPGFDRPVYAVFSADGSTAYVMNCGPECGGTRASVQTMSFATTPPIAGAAVAVDGATVGLLSGSTLYVAGISPTNSACTGQTTAATTCGRLDILDLGSMAVTSTAVITDGYHDRIDISSNGQLFIGSHTCTTIGNVNNPQGEVRGCLSIYNTANATIVIPPDSGDVTGLQNFSTRTVEYVAEGGNLRVYDTTIDALLLNTLITTGTVNVAGQIIDVKAIDFF